MILADDIELSDADAIRLGWPWSLMAAANEPSVQAR